MRSRHHPGTGGEIEVTSEGDDQLVIHHRFDELKTHIFPVIGGICIISGGSCSIRLHPGIVHVHIHRRPEQLVEEVLHAVRQDAVDDTGNRVADQFRIHITGDNGRLWCKTFEDDQIGRLLTHFQRVPVDLFQFGIDRGIVAHRTVRWHHDLEGRIRLTERTREPTHHKHITVFPQHV